MNKDLECALAMISRLVGIAIRNRPSEESKRRTFYVDIAQEHQNNGRCRHKATAVPRNTQAEAEAVVGRQEGRMSFENKSREWHDISVFFAGGVKRLTGYFTLHGADEKQER